MTSPLKVIQIGNSFGVVLPKELLARLRVGKGDNLSWSEVPGGVALRAGDAEFDRQMAIAEEIMREDRDILRILAQ
jgi:putative addiction module antidote